MSRYSLLKATAIAACAATIIGTGAQAQQAPKPLIHGLISMGNIGFHRADGGVPDNSLKEIEAHPGVLTGVVINITWAQLQPTPKSLDTAALDGALSDVNAYNAHHPQSPLAVKLRIWPGPSAPQWAKELGGPPVQLVHAAGNQNLIITVGRYWAVAYRKAWWDLQHALARKYDSDPLIREISNSSCSTITDEGFLEAADPVSIQNLVQAGYTDQAFQTCLTQSPNDYSGWKTTRVDWAFNPYRGIESGKPVMDMSFTYQVMDGFRQSMGERGIVTNHALEVPTHPFLLPLFDHIRQVGAPIEFQTDSPKALGGMDWDATIKMGLSLGASAIEVWQGTNLNGFETIPPDTMKQWNAQLGDH